MKLRTNKTEQNFHLIGKKTFQSEQNFTSSRNCNEIRNKILLKTEQNFYIRKKNSKSWHISSEPFIIVT